MAKVILDSTDTQYTVANNNVEVKGASGNQTIVVNSGVTGLTVDSTIEDVDFSGNVADYTFSQDGAGNITIYSGGVAITTVSGANGKTLSFADGTVALETTFDGTTGGINLGGTAVGTTAGAVVPATIDATDTSSNADGGSTTTPSSTELTTGIDTLTGTSGDDTFTGLQTGGDDETFSAYDTIIGGEGTDTLTIINTESNTAPNAATVQEVEIINWRDAVGGAANSLDMSDFDGETHLNINASQNQFAVTNLELATVLTVTDAKAAFDSTFTYLSTDVTGSTDAGNITLDGIADGAEIDLAGNIESLTVTTTGDDSRLDEFVLPGTVTALTVDAAAGLRVDDTFTAAALETLTISGAGAVRIDPALAATVETVSAGSATGAINLTVGAADMTITTGAGDDTIDLQGNLDKDDTIDLGDGTDTVVVNVSGLSAGSHDLSLSNVEGLQFDNMNDTDGAINMDNVSVNTIQFNGVNAVSTDEATGDVTLTDLATSNTTFDFVGQGSDGSTSDDVKFNGVVVDYDATDDRSSVTLNFGNAGVTADSMYVDMLDVNRTEAIVINASDIGTSSGDALNIDEIEADDATELTVTANSDVVIDDLDGDVIETVDVSAVTGGATVTITDHAAALTITGSAAADTIVTADNTSTHEITVDLGEGNDSYTSVDATDTITTGSGSDTISFQGDVNDDDNIITDFTAGSGGDIIDFVTNAANDGGATLSDSEVMTTSQDDNLEAGITFIDNSQAGIANADSLSAADIIDRLNDLGDDNNGGAADDIISMEASDDDNYVVISDGTDTALVLVADASADDTVIETGDVEIIVTLQGVSDVSTLTVANFADFV